jgi:aminoglycoside 6'-N-acetyltransferase
MNISFRRLTRDDFELMAKWLSTPHVEKWWEHDYSLEGIERDFGPGIDRLDPVDYFIVLLDDEPIGFIQRHIMRDNPQWFQALQVVNAQPDSIGIDYFIGKADLCNRGIGTAMIGALINDTRALYPGAEMLVDIDPENRPSWRALERNGFVHIWTGELDVPENDGPVWMYRLTL